MDKNQLFGGNPMAVLVRLVILSIVVGIVLSVLKIQPQEIFQYVRHLAEWVYSLGFGAVRDALGFLALGGAVVVPIWLIARLLGSFRRRNDHRQP